MPLPWNVRTSTTSLSNGILLIQYLLPHEQETSHGGNNLEKLKTPDDRWKVRLIEEDFHRLMFEMEGA